MTRTRNEIWDLCQSYFDALTSRRDLTDLNSQLDLFFGAASALELHEFPTCWNWDSGTNRIKQLISHPNCDAGTALKTYWLFRPHYYLEFANRDGVPDYQRDDFDLMEHIQEAYLDGRYATSEMRYRPPRKPRRAKPNWVRSIPDKMYEPVVPQSAWSRIRLLIGV